MSYTPEELYRLLPAVYRIRDADLGEPLKALVTVLSGQARVAEKDIYGLYRNWFIETCEEWVVPYLGDLLGVRGLHPLPGQPSFSHRARVANTLAYRRRKGTAAMLEQLARDTTGWPARVVEYFQLLGTTQHYHHVRLGNVRTPDLRQAGRLELLNSPFDTVAHTVEVRHIASGQGRYNLPHIGLHLWRLQAYEILGGLARPVTDPPDGRYFFDPLGASRPLCQVPQTETEISHLAGETNVPAFLRRRPLYEELEARRQASVDGTPFVSLYFGQQPVFELWTQQTAADPFQAVLPETIVIADLSDTPAGWLLPVTPRDYVPQAGGAPQSRDLVAAVDPLLGRLALLNGTIPLRVKVNYAYGFSGEVGAGPFNRQESLKPHLDRPVLWQRGVAQSMSAVPGEILNTLGEAVSQWNSWSATHPGGVGMIVLMDNFSYREELTGTQAIEIPEGNRLLVVAADWPEVPVPGGLPGQRHRVVGQAEPDNRRPHLQGALEIRGTAAATSRTAGELILNGLLIEGSLQVDESGAGHLGGLQIEYCTVMPPSLGLRVQGQSVFLAVTLSRTLCGPVILDASCQSLTLRDCLIDGGAMDPGVVTAIKAEGAAVDIQACTLFGAVTVRQIEAGNSLFTAPVTATRLQAGCVRFCHVPPDALGQYATPRRYRCQPELAQSQVPASQATTVALEMRPVFEGLAWGDPHYGQLSQSCAQELRSGAEDGSEMGVFFSLKQPQRLANLLASLPEFLPFGLEAGVVYET